MLWQCYVHERIRSPDRSDIFSVNKKAFQQPKEQDVQCVDNLFPRDLLFNHQLLKTTTKMTMKSGFMKVETDGGNMINELMSTLVTH